MISAHRTSLLLAGLVLAGLLPAALPAAAAPTSSAGCSAAYFHPLDPDRVYDSATATAAGRVGQSPVTIDLSSEVPAGACAVVATLTGASATANTYVTAYEAGATRPNASNLNLLPGANAADLVTVGIGADRELALFNHAGLTRLIVDLAGYYSADPEVAGDTYVPLTPTRVLDTATTIGDAPGQVPRAGTVTLTPAQLHVPTGADAVLVNLTAVGGGVSTYVSAYPAGSARPATSDLNVAAGDTRAALASVRLSPSGLTLYDNAGSVRLLADIEGWYSTTATGTVFSTTAQARVGARLAAGQVADVSIDGNGATPAAALFTLTAAGASAGSVERAYPTPTGDAAVPSVSNVNVDRAVDTPNLVAVALTPGSGTGSVRLLDTGGTPSSTVDDLVDPAGVFTARPPGNDVSFATCSGPGTVTTLPADAAFGIVNPTAGGLAFSGTSPCLAAEDSWAAATGDEEFYLPLSDRGPSSANWPADCVDQDTAACAYEFGRDQAEDVYADAAGTGHAATRWWLDVETSAPWQSSTSLNAQVVAGALASLQARSGVSVGVYSTASQWSQLLGSTSYPALPEWYATAGRSDAQLAGACTTPFAAGAVRQVQDGSLVAAVLDRDLRC